MVAVENIQNALLRTSNKWSIAGWVTYILMDLQVASYAQIDITLNLRVSVLFPCFHRSKHLSV